MSSCLNIHVSCVVQGSSQSSSSSPQLNTRTTQGAWHTAISVPFENLAALVSKSLNARKLCTKISNDFPNLVKSYYAKSKKSKFQQCHVQDNCNSVT